MAFETTKTKNQEGLAYITRCTASCVFQSFGFEAKLQDSLWDAARQAVSISVVNGRETTATKNIFISRKHKFYLYLRKSKTRFIYYQQTMA
jgi:hypothetical protein